jgi:hypothetical protein
MLQTQVNLQPAPAVAGDFASANPKITVDAGAGGLVSGAAGVTVGKFAWVDPLNPTIANNFGSSASGAPYGFVHREQQALITTFLADNSQTVLPGLPVVLHSGGDFWAKNQGVSTTAINDAVYASYADGSIANSLQTAAAFTASIGGVVTGSIGASFTASGSGTNLTISAVTGVVHVGDLLGTTTGIPAGTTIVSITSGSGGAGVVVTSVATTISAAAATTTSKVLDVTAVTSGTVQVTDIISGGAIATGTTITGVLTGVVAGIGTYSLSGGFQSFASAAVTLSSLVMNVTAVASGTIAIGDPVTGTNVTSGSVITGLVAGSLTKYTMSLRSTTVSESMATVAGVVTKWKFMSVAAVGELAKISSWLLG